MTDEDTPKAVTDEDNTEAVTEEDRTEAASVAAADGPPAETIEEAITRLEKEVSEAQTKKDDAGTALADRQNRLVALRAAQRDLDSGRDAYAAAHDGFARDQKAFADYLSSETTRLTDLLGTTTAEKVKKKAAAVTAKTTELEGGVDDSQTALTAAENARDAAKKEAAARSAEAADLKKLTAAITARHKRLKSRQDEITTAERSGQDALALYLLTGRDFKSTVEGPPAVIAPGDVPARLLDALDKQAAAEKALSEKEQAVTKSRAGLAAAQNRLKIHNATAEADLRRDLTRLTPEGA